MGSVARNTGGSGSGSGGGGGGPGGGGGGGGGGGPPAPGAAAGAAAAFGQGRFIKFNKPGQFLGDPAWFKPWLVQINLYLDSNQCTDDLDRINFTLGFMSGAAGDWKQDYIDRRPQGETWRTFQDALDQAFAPIQQDFEAEEKLDRLRQRGRYIEEYISNFAVLVSQAHIPDSISLQSYFKKGLDPAVRHEALRRNPRTIQEWKEATRLAYQVVVEQQRFRAGQSSRRSTKRQTPRKQVRRQSNYNGSYQPNPRYTNIRNEPITYGNNYARNEWDMEVDYLNEIINQLDMDEEQDDEDLNELYDSDEEDLNNHEEYDSDEEEVNYTSQRRQSNSNGRSKGAKGALDHLINNVLTDEQRQALRRGECFFCKKKGHFYRDCEARKVYLNSARKKSMANRPAPRATRQTNNNQKQKGKRPFRNNQKRKTDPNAMVYNVEDDDDDYDEFNSNENF